MPSGHAAKPHFDPGDYRTSQSTTEKLKEKASGAIASAQDQAAQLGSRAAEKIDHSRRPAANAMETAATALHDKADSLPGGKKAADLAHRTADTIQDTADYVREHDTKAMKNDVVRFVRNHPGKSLAVAVAIGFLFGRAMRRD